MSLATRSERSTRGNAAMTFAIALVPLVGAIGAAVDYAHVVEVRAQLVAALDAGILAASHRPGMSDTEAAALVTDAMSARLGPTFAGAWKLDSVTGELGGRIVAKASGNVDTTIAWVIGINEVPISAESAAMRSPR